MCTDFVCSTRAGILFVRLPNGRGVLWWCLIMPNGVEAMAKSISSEGNELVVFWMTRLRR